MDTTNTTNNSENVTLLNIHTILARQGQILDNVTQDLREIRDDVKDIRGALKDYIPRSEAKLQFDAMQSSMLAMQTQLAEMQAWRLASSVAAVKDINAVQLTNKQEVSNVKEAGWTRLLSIQGAAWVIVAGFIVWLIEQLVSTTHLLGK